MYSLLLTAACIGCDPGGSEGYAPSASRFQVSYYGRFGRPRFQLRYESPQFRTYPQFNPYGYAAQNGYGPHYSPPQVYGGYGPQFLSARQFAGNGNGGGFGGY
jgi:hypothetical protein